MAEAFLTEPIPKHHRKCSLTNCDGTLHCKGFCRKHYERMRIHNSLIPLIGPDSNPKLCNQCDQQHYCQGLCRSHYEKEIYKSGAKKYYSKPHRKVDKRGYVYLWKPDHLNSDGNGMISEHRFVMAKYLGRPLLDNEHVHHKNSNRSDNLISNLELWIKPHPTGSRVLDVVADAVKTLNLYAPELLKENNNG